MSKLVTAARLHTGLALLLSLLVGVSHATAQVSLDQLKPAPLASDGFAMSRPQVLRHLEWGAVAVLEYAKDPLVLEIHRPTARELSVVEHHLVLHAGLALGLGKRITIFSMLAVHGVMKGQDATGFGARKADGPGLGDTVAGGRILLLNDVADRLSVSAEFLARLPSADLANGSQVYSGDKVGSYEPALTTELGVGSRFEGRIRVGVRLRRPVQVRDLELGQELVYGIGARYRILDGLHMHAELFGASNVAGLDDIHRTPLELLVGPKYRSQDWFFGLALGRGLVRGYGAPDLRLVGTLGYAPVAKDKNRGEGRDSDGDGLVDSQDQCPRAPEDKDGFEDRDGCTDPDNDRDRVLDRVDRCPLKAEDIDTFEDADGCPDVDNDKDLTLDINDKCPLEAEDNDGFEDDDGCPEPDNDKDLFPDAFDDCPLEPEDTDNFRDDDGCAEPDNDNDLVRDVDDACPLVPGAPAAKGCPVEKAPALESGKLVLLGRVEFEVDEAVILEASTPVLKNVWQTLASNPSYKRIRIEGHTDDAGNDASNLDLSRRRARAVAFWLRDHGLPIERMEAWGCGEARPVSGNDTKQGRKENRRVEFHITDPAPPVEQSTEGCMQIDL